MSRLIDFEFNFRPVRTIYIVVLAALVYFVSDSVLAGLITLLASVDIQDDLGKDDE